MRLKAQFLVFAILALGSTIGGAQENSQPRTPDVRGHGSAGSAIDLTQSQERTGNVVLQREGNSIAYCPALGCIPGRDFDHMRTSQLVSSVTNADGEAEENTLSVNTLVRTGAAKPWRPETKYRVGDNIKLQGLVDGAERNDTYRATSNGTSGARPPAGKGRGIRNGTMTWDWINYGATNAKVGIYNSLDAVAGGSGSVWAQANNMRLSPGLDPVFAVNTELDLHNDSGVDCDVGRANCYGLYITPRGDLSTAAVSIQTKGQAENDPALVWGLRMSSKDLARDALIELDASGAKRGIGINAFDMGAVFTEAEIRANATAPRTLFVTGSKSVAAIQDQSKAPTSLFVQGEKTTADVILSATAPKGIEISGSKSAYSVLDRATAPVGISLQGQYAEKQISGKGWGVSPDGRVYASSIKPAAYKVAGLPECGKERMDEIVVVTDARAPDYRAPLRGGGRERTLAFCDGSQWTSH